MSRTAATELKPILNVKDVAAVLGLTEDTVCSWVRRGELLASGLGTDRLGRPCPPYAVLRENLFEFLTQRQLAIDTSSSAKGTRHRSQRSPQPRARRHLVSAEVSA